MAAWRHPPRLARHVCPETIYEAVRLEAGLVAGDPDSEVSIAWTIARQVMALYQLDDPAQARSSVAELTAALRECPIPELARLGRTLHAWQPELIAHFDHPDVSNGPTENLNLKIKNTKRIARGYRNFEHYRLRLLLNHIGTGKIAYRRESETALPG